MDVIFTIVSRNYAAQAATLMRSLAAAEPSARRVVVAADGPIPELAPFAEVVEAAELGAPVRDMAVYYEALELNTAVKPFVMRSLLARDGLGSVTYLDPDIYVFAPLDAVRAGLERSPLCLTPHTTRPLATPGKPSNEDLARSGTYNLGFVAMRRDPRVDALLDWWAERCRFDCRVDFEEGLFTDQKWMDRAAEFVPEPVVLTAPGLNLAYWNLEGRALARGPGGWTVDGQPLAFFHFSGFDPARPRRLSRHQDRIAVRPGSPLAALLGFYARELRRDGHAAASARGYAFDRFDSGRRVTPLMRRRALRAARSGEGFPDRLGPATEAWMDAPDPEAAAPELPPVTRLMRQAWGENAVREALDLSTRAGRLGLARWFADNAVAVGADESAAAAARAILETHGPFDPAELFPEDPDGLMAWRLGPEAAAGRFDPAALPPQAQDRLAGRPDVLARAAAWAGAGKAGELRRRYAAAFEAPHRARWPRRLSAPVQAPYLFRADDLPARFFFDIWASRPDLQHLYRLDRPLGRFRYLRWLLAGGLEEYGVPPAALPRSLRDRPLMRLAALSLAGRR